MSPPFSVGGMAVVTKDKSIIISLTQLSTKVEGTSSEKDKVDLLYNITLIKITKRNMCMHDNTSLKACVSSLD